MIDELAGQGLVLRETCRDIARCGLGVAVRAGAPKPDIATPDAFKDALLAARSMVRSSEGTSGVYFENLLQRLGIADLLRGKIVLGPSGRVAEMVARGEAELAVQQIPELLPVEGVDFAGPFPDALQLYHDLFGGRRRRRQRSRRRHRAGRGFGGAVRRGAVQGPRA